jgi:TonB family protein
MDTIPMPAPKAEETPDPDTPPLVISVVPASYTEEARNAGFHGKVFVTVYVDAAGVPRDIEATSPMPFGLERTIRQAVFQWRFQPALSHGVAVAGKTMLEMPFR